MAKDEAARPRAEKVIHLRSGEAEAPGRRVEVAAEAYQWLRSIAKRPRHR